MKPTKPKLSNRAVNGYMFSFAQNLLNKYFKPSAKKNQVWHDYRNSPLVYHYTSFDSFYKIISTESLIASNALYLNDTQEFKFSNKFIGFSLEDCLKNKRLSKLAREIIGEITTSIDDINVSEHYVTCFSASRDLLSQWVAYGDRGNGLAIGFEAKELDRCF